MSNRTKGLIGLAVLIVLVGGGIVWYRATHVVPPVALLPDTLGTTTPSVVTPTKPVTYAPIHITDNAAYYDIGAEYPSATSLKTGIGATADANAVAAMKSFEQDTITQFKTDGNFANLTPADIQMQNLGQRKYALQIDYKTYASSNTVSYVYTIYEDTLGAHPNTSFRTFTFDTKTGASLTLGDLFNDPNYLQTLGTIAQTDLPAIIAKIGGTSISDVDHSQLDPGITPDAVNFANFYLDGSNLVIVFPPYQVGPYALGTVTLPIPLSQLSGSLKSSYQ